MKKLMFVRHGQSSANRDGIVTGNLDVPLTALGVQQAHQLGRRCDQKFDLIVSSPMQRAACTARILASHVGYDGQRIIFLGDLSERCMGLSQGGLVSEIETKYQDRDLAPGVESSTDLRHRLLRIWQYLQQRPEENILIVAHSWSGRALLQVIHGTERPLEQEAGIDNARMIQLFP